MRRVLLALGGAAVLAVTGCSGGAPRASTPTTRPHAAAAPNPDVIPRSITPAYVDAVFVKLNHVYGDAVRSELQSHSVSQAVKTDLRAIYNDPQYQQELGIFSEGLSEGLSKLRSHPGDPQTRVLAVESTSKRCVFVSVKTDLSRLVAFRTPTAASDYYMLTPKQPDIDPDSLNTTPWAISLNVSYIRPTPVRDQCPE